jgi:A/G-specific adenine glycosylase
MTESAVAVAVAVAVAPALLRWFDRQRRDLPWRRAPTPYRTLVSEFMLQQTVVATVEPYFNRFLARFPDLAALAAAREEEVVALWSGLGYYARARNLHRAAGAVMARHGGQIPSDEAALRLLPGIGAYTAAAVAAIAFDRRAFALDGNAVRVLARLHAVGEPVNRPATRAYLRELGSALVPSARAGDFNQAVMELGALVCVPKAPRCGECPLRDRCAAHAAGRAAELPVKQPKAPRRAVRIACALVQRRGRVLLVRRQSGELLAGTWALPSAAVADAGAPSAEIARAAAVRSGIAAGRAELRGTIRHVFTHRDLTAEIFAVRETPAAAPALALAPARRAADRDPDPVDRCWARPDDLGALGISSFTRKTLAVGLAHRKQDNAAKRP